MSLRNLLVAVVLSLGCAGNAAADLVGGLTNIRLTLAPSLSGISLSTLGTATVASDSSAVPTFSFPITSDTGTSLGHEGSGLRFSSPGTTWDLTNLVVNFTTGIVSARSASTVSGTTQIAQSLSLFTLVDAGSTFQLRFATDGLTLFSSLFPSAANIAQSRVIGTAFATAPVAPPPIRPVPEPATWALILAGAIMFGMLAHRRSIL